MVDDLYDEFVEKFSDKWAKVQPGDPTDLETLVGPLSSESAVDDLLGLADDARAKGANVRVGGGRYDRDGAWMQPTVVTDLTPDMRLYREEAFGPLAAIYRVSDVDAAVELANDTPFGLGSTVVTQDPQLASDVADSGPLATVLELPNGQRFRLIPAEPGSPTADFSLVLTAAAVDEFAKAAPISSRVGRDSLSPLDEAEYDVIVETLRRCGGDTTTAAVELKISRGTLFGRLRRCGITA